MSILKEKRKAWRVNECMIANKYQKQLKAKKT